MRSSISLEYRHRYYGNQARWLNASLLSKSDLRLSLDHRQMGRPGMQHSASQDF